MEELTQVSHKMAEKMYQGAAGPEAPGAAPGPDPQEPPPPGDGGNVVDAEFEESR